VLLGVTLLAGVLVLFAARSSLAARAAEHYLALMHVPASVGIERLDLRVASGSVSLGTPGSPDLQAHLQGLIDWNGLTPVLRSLRVDSLLVRGSFDGRRVSFGVLDRLLEELAKHRAAGSMSVGEVVLNGVRVRIDAAVGELVLTGDARVESGTLRTLHARLLPGELRGLDFVLHVTDGMLSLESRGDTMAVHGAAAGTVSATAMGVPIAARWLRLQLAAASLMRDASGLPHTLEDVHVEAEARGAQVGALAAQTIALQMDALRADLGSFDDVAASPTALHATLALSGLTGPSQWGVKLSTLDATLRGRIGLVPGGLLADVRAAGQAQAEIPSPRVRALARRVPVLGADARFVSAVSSAARSLTISFGDIRGRSDGGHLNLTLDSPVIVRGARDAHLVLAPAPPRTLLSGDAATARLAGAFGLEVAGRGLPRVQMDVSSYSLEPEGGGEMRVDARMRVAARLTAGQFEGLAVSATAHARHEAGRYRLDIERCADVTADALLLMNAHLTSVHGLVCGAQQPLLEADASRWRASGLWHSFATQLADLQLAVSDGNGRFELAGDGSQLSTARVAADAQIEDRAHELRFAPVRTEGTLSLSNDEWRGGFGLRLTQSGEALAALTVRQSLASGAGDLQFTSSELTFAPAGLQPVKLSPLLRSWSSASGRAQLEAGLSWSSSGRVSHGRLRLEDMGLSSPVGRIEHLQADVALTSLYPLRSAAHQMLAVGEVDTLLPITGLDAHFELLPESVRIEDLSMQLVGGTVLLDPASVPFTTDGTIESTVRLKDINLNKLIAASTLADRMTLDVPVSGAIPFSFGPAGLRLTNGLLFSTAPGRLAIDRRIWSAPQDQVGAVQDFAYQAMEHLAIDGLDAKVNSLSDGRLGFVLHMKGHHDPPNAQDTRLGIMDLLRGRAFERPVPLPKGTPIELTVDSALNVDGLVSTYRAGLSAPR
jgi:hypothetical protein